MLTRIIRHAVPLFVWTALYLVVYNLVDTQAVDLRRQAVQSVFGSGRPAYHLWYLYSYIPLITLFGALVLFWKGKRPWILVALGLLFASGGVVSEWSQKALDLELGSWSWSFGTYGAAYFILGGFLVHNARNFSVPRWVLVVVFGLAAIGVYLWETEVHYPIQNANPLTFILAACVVLMCGTITVQERTMRLLKKLASASFGAFLIHIFFVDLMFWHLFPLDLSWPATAGLFFICWVAVAAVSFAFSLTWGALKLRRVLG
ncbi:acyltransferase [Brevibacterium luteolum]|uniref:acyltransferase n=1 Tax=Brevibacterium luteolum TaxID=199591 RepID=UPI00223B1062|nr:acyltransferase [Brevibacterium luteolum]MCT1657891.1 acyltransferase [Brevibacterium luteolum]